MQYSSRSGVPHSGNSLSRSSCEAGMNTNWRWSVAVSTPRSGGRPSLLRYIGFYSCIEVWLGRRIPMGAVTLGTSGWLVYRTSKCFLLPVPSQPHPIWHLMRVFWSCSGLWSSQHPSPDAGTGPLPAKGVGCLLAELPQWTDTLFTVCIFRN